MLVRGSRGIDDEEIGNRLSGNNVQSREERVYKSHFFVGDETQSTHGEAGRPPQDPHHQILFHPKADHQKWQHRSAQQRDPLENIIMPGIPSIKYSQRLRDVEVEPLVRREGPLPKIHPIRTHRDSQRYAPAEDAFASENQKVRGGKVPQCQKLVELVGSVYFFAGSILGDEFAEFRTKYDRGLESKKTDRGPNEKVCGAEEDG